MDKTAKETAEALAGGAVSFALIFEILHQNGVFDRGSAISSLELTASALEARCGQSSGILLRLAVSELRKIESNGKPDLRIVKH